VSATRLGAHAGAPLQTGSLTYLYERNLVSRRARQNWGHHKLMQVGGYSTPEKDDILCEANSNILHPGIVFLPYSGIWRSGVQNSRYIKGADGAEGVGGRVMELLE
jgi:hypothetical protein